MSPNRIVAVATPLLFAPLAGAVSAWLAVHFPGFNIDRGALEEVFIAGALIALAPAAQWLHGWQKFEARQADLAREVAVEHTPAPDDFTGAAPDGEAGFEELEDLEDLEDLESLDDMDDLDLDELEDDLLAEDEQELGVGI
jgi:hypothetical protein